MNPDDFVMIHDHVIESRGRGHCLPQTEIDVIRTWIACAGHIDDVILTLDEFLPKLFESTTTVPPSLKRIDKKVKTRLTELRQRRSQL